MNNRGRDGESCGDCLYWINATCRRFQPLQVPSAKAIWPSVSRDDWCGEWEPDKITRLQSGIASAQAHYEVYLKYEPQQAQVYKQAANAMKLELEALIS